MDVSGLELKFKEFKKHTGELGRKTYNTGLKNVDSLSSTINTNINFITAPWAKLDERYRYGAIFIIGFGCGSGLTKLRAVMSRISKRFSTAEEVPIEYFRNQSFLRGQVAKVTDGDTFRMYHKPKWSMFSSNSNSNSNSNDDGKQKLSETTMVIRLAAVECPETAKLGQSGQVGGKEATEFLYSLLQGQSVSVQLLSKDQYARIVGMVYIGSWPFRKNVSKELLRAGFATIYRQGGAEYGGILPQLEGLEQQAKEKKVGLWAVGEGGETAAEYKKRVKKEARLVQATP